MRKSNLKRTEVLAVVFGAGILALASMSREAGANSLPETATPTSQTTISSVMSDSTLIERLREHQVLLVPGFLYDPLIVPNRNSVLRALRVGEYFNEQRKWLQANKIQVQTAVIDSEDTVAENGADLALLIEAAKKPLIIVSHSKGGMETLEALLQRPELRPKVKLWISLQTPFAGSEVADFVYSHESLRSASRKLLEDCWDGNLDSLKEMQTNLRLQYMHRNYIAIEKLSSEVRIIAVGSSIKEKGAPGGLPAMLPLVEIMNSRGAGPNDGLVSLFSSKLPGARFQFIPQMDHADPVMPFPGRTYDRLGLFKSLIVEGLLSLEDGQE
jgi:hypothetical protein